MMKLHEDHKKLIIVVFFGVISLVALIGSSFIDDRRNTSSTQAANNTPSKCNCTDPNNCYPDGCSGKPKTPDNKLDSNRYDQVCKNINFGWPPDLEVQKYFCSIRQPDSCFDVYQYKDDRYACFMERWFCHPSLCVGAGGNGDCGKYWNVPDEYKNTPGSYGCIKWTDPNTKIPVWGLPPNLPGQSQTQPTNTPRPIATSTPRPTNTPQPTSTPAPINSPIPTNQQPTSAANTESPYNPQPTNPPLPTNTPYTFPTIEIKSPKELAREVINPQNIQKLKTKTAAPLEVPRKGFNSIKAIDKKLETFTQSFFQKVWSKIVNFIDR